MNFKRLNYTEPAVLRGIVAALVALAAAIGFTVSADLSALADSVIVVVSLVVPLVQAVATRHAVVSPATADADVATAQALASGQTPGVADHAAPEENQ